MSSESNEKQKERDFIIEFINTYRSLTALWDVNCKDYNDRQKKEDQSEILLKKYRERHLNATKKDVNRKINILRSNFKRELKRLTDAKKDLSSSSLYYFDALSFIKDIKSTDSMWSHFALKEDPQRRKSKKESTPANDALIPVLKPSKKKPSTYQKSSEVWVLKLQDMDIDQGLIAEKLINDVIFHGQLNKLTMNTKLFIESRSPSPNRPSECNQQFLKMENTFDLVQSTYSNATDPNTEYTQQTMPPLTGPYRPKFTVQNEKYFFE